MGMAAIVAGVRQRHAGLVIELNEYHRAVDPVIKRRDRIELSDPGEERFVECV